VGGDAAPALNPGAISVWRNIRIVFLLFVAAIAGWSNWYDRLSTTDWDETLHIGVFPINPTGGPVSGEYIHGLVQDDFAAIAAFFDEEAARHGVGLGKVARVELYPEVREQPPAVAPKAGMLQNIWWSLRMRLYARRNARPPARAPPQIRIFVLYHDPAFSGSVPHSVGLQKGLVGVVHAFAASHMDSSNNVVIAHEILHTLGASDKYDFATLAPLYPGGFAEPERQPRFPQKFAEIMGGRLPLDSSTFEIPESLDEVLVGDATALEIRWVGQ
jgi:hypothetical protein